MSLYLVFEHVHQDLATYLENCPSPGLAEKNPSSQNLCDDILDIFISALSMIIFRKLRRLIVTKVEGEPKVWKRIRKKERPFLNDILFNRD